MDKTTLLFVCRHGTTVLNQKKLFRGTADPVLAPEGRADAEQLAEYFAPIDLSAIFYSDKRRSEETAHIISSKKNGVPCYGTSSLHALNVGNFSGQPKSPENVQKLQHYIDNPNVSIPGGESLQSFKNRVRPCLMEGMELANKAGKPVLFVVHSSVVHEVGSMLHDDHEATVVKPGGLIHIYTDGKNLCAEPLLRPDANRHPEQIS